MKLSKPLADARTYYNYLKTTHKSIAEAAADLNVNKANISYGNNIWKRRRSFKLYDWSYGQIRETLTVPDDYFQDCMKQMQLDATVSCRQIKDRVSSYMNERKYAEPMVTDTDYVFLGGCRFFIDPAVKGDIMKLIGIEEFE